MYEYRATVVRVVDADTLILDVDLGLRSWVHGKSYRLARVNAPEMSSPEGVKARQAVVDLLPNQQIIVRTIKDGHDRYDRYIAEVILPDGTNLSDWLLSNGWAVPYPAPKS